jgi:hypothetical protein
MTELAGSGGTNQADLPFTEIRLMERPCFGHFRAPSLKI